MLKRFLAVLLSLLAVLLIPSEAYAASVSAQSAVVIDAKTNCVLYSKNEKAPMPMASTTKIMTALIALESGKCAKSVTITNEMLLGTNGTSLYLKEGDRITLFDLVAGMLIVSGNDCANAAAVAVSGSVEDFVELMNKKAHEFGMENTLFVTPSGLDSGNHHSTAYDMALLAARAMSNEYFSKIVSSKSMKITVNGEEKIIYNHNKLLSMSEYCMGIKTGYTQKAGRCLVSCFEKDSRMLICVTLNAPNDWNDHLALFDESLEKYKEVTVSGEVIVPLVGAVSNSLHCTYSKQVYLPEPDKYSVELFYFPFVYAGVSKGDAVGICKIYSGENLIAKAKIVSNEQVEFYR